MSSVNQLLDRPGALIAVSIVLAVVVGLITSSLLGFGIFIFLPSLVMWLARR
jgi:high-affinity Fe2+/Pb2+ permease